MRVLMEEKERYLRIKAKRDKKAENNKISKLKI